MTQALYTLRELFKLTPHGNSPAGPDLSASYGMKTPPNPTGLSAIGQRLTLLRLAKGMKQAEFGRLVGIGAQSLNNYEQGRRRISHDQALKVCVATGVSLDWVYRGLASSGLPADLQTKIQALEKSGAAARPQ